MRNRSVGREMLSTSVHGFGCVFFEFGYLNIGGPATNGTSP
jgi:hypothetical protein